MPLAIGSGNLTCCLWQDRLKIVLGQCGLHWSPSASASPLANLSTTSGDQWAVVEPCVGLEKGRGAAAAVKGGKGGLQKGDNEKKA